MTTEDSALPCATFLQRFASPYRERPQTAVAGEGLWRLSSRRRLESVSSRSILAHFKSPSINLKPPAPDER